MGRNLWSGGCGGAVQLIKGSRREARASSGSSNTGFEDGLVVKSSSTRSGPDGCSATDRIARAVLPAQPLARPRV